MLLMNTLGAMMIMSSFDAADGTASDGCAAGGTDDASAGRHDGAAEEERVPE